MVWALLYVLGVPLWLIAGALLRSFWSRRKFKQAPGVFPYKVRVATGPAPPGEMAPRYLARALGPRRADGPLGLGTRALPGVAGRFDQRTDRRGS